MEIGSSLESIYYRKPVAMSHYKIFLIDSESLGFCVIGFDDFIDFETSKQARHALIDRAFIGEMVEHNPTLGYKHY